MKTFADYGQFDNFRWVAGLHPSRSLSSGGVPLAARGVASNRASCTSHPLHSRTIGGVLVLSTSGDATVFLRVER